MDFRFNNPAPLLCRGHARRLLRIDLVANEEIDFAAVAVANGIIDGVLDEVYERTISDKVKPYVARRCREALTCMVEAHFLNHDNGEPTIETDPRWKIDEEPPASTPDSWARGCIQVVKARKNYSTAVHSGHFHFHDEPAAAEAEAEAELTPAAEQPRPATAAEAGPAVTTGKPNPDAAASTVGPTGQGDSGELTDATDYGVSESGRTSDSSIRPSRSRQSQSRATRRSERGGGPSRGRRTPGQVSWVPPASAMKADLEAVATAYDDAIRMVAQLRDIHISELRQLNVVPKKLLSVLEAVMLLKGVTAEWKVAKQEVGAAFISELVYFEKNQIPRETLSRLATFPWVIDAGWVL